MCILMDQAVERMSASPARMLVAEPVREDSAIFYALEPVIGVYFKSLPDGNACE